MDNLNSKKKYFDSIARKWDSWENLGELMSKLLSGVEKMGIKDNETILDIGCGTGNLSKVLLFKLSKMGRVIAVDFSKEMLLVAKEKISDYRFLPCQTNAHCLPFKSRSYDRIFCYSVWPHFDRAEEAATEFLRVLKSGGHLHLWHLGDRLRINQIHSSACEAIKNDFLEPVDVVASRLIKLGFKIKTAIENKKYYLITASKEP